jgi:pimeloyl-ACP methyl ester carboxylesterase
MLGLYTTFLSALHSKAKEASQSIAILAQAHIGLAPELPPPPISGPVTLQMSVDSAIDALDNLAAQYGSKTKYILVGHSLGTWISTLVLKARPNLVSSVLMLFPTISNIAKVMQCTLV